MRLPRKISLFVLIAFFLLSGATFAQSPAKENYLKGIAYASQGKFAKAKAEFKKALKANPFYSQAKDDLETIIDVTGKKIKTKTAIHLFKGLSYFYKGQYDQAIRDYTKTLEINPRYAKAYNNRCVAYRRKGQYDRAIRDCNKALELNPKYDKAYNNRGNAYSGKGQYDRAIRDYTKALGINPKNAIAYNNRGTAYYKKGQYGRATRNYTKAIAFNPKYANAYRNRGFVYFKNLGNKAKGCADWKRACELGKCKNYNIVKRKGQCP